MCAKLELTDRLSLVVVHSSSFLKSESLSSLGQLYTIYILLTRDMVKERWNRQFGCETIHPKQKFTSMNMFQNALCDNMGMIVFDL